MIIIRLVLAASALLLAAPTSVAADGILSAISPDTEALHVLKLRVTEQTNHFLARARAAVSVTLGEVSHFVHSGSIRALLEYGCFLNWV